jgi:(p)ppGpp synthase/HD superfamily hydrolase
MVQDTDHLDNLSSELEQVPGVIEVERKVS